MRPERNPAHDSPAKARLFFALWPSPELAGQLAGMAGEAARQLGGRPTRQDTVHLTLAFLGNLPETLLPALCDAASRVEFNPFDLVLDQLACWPRQHLLWAGSRAVPPALPALVGSLREALGLAGIAVDARERSFTPHVTLVRKLPAELSPGVMHQVPEIGSLHWPCREFVLVRSQLAESGPRYLTLARFPAKPLLC